MVLERPTIQSKTPIRARSLIEVNPLPSVANVGTVTATF
jgi:hypothetical protein